MCIDTVHQATLNFECEKCGEDFSREDNLKRHQKENHFKINANLDFVEDFDTFILNKCDLCDKSFKRKDQLKRHVNTVHSNPAYKKQFKCDRCDSKFSNPDNLKRHVKQKHPD